MLIDKLVGAEAGGLNHEAEATFLRVPDYEGPRGGAKAGGI